ncbi:hypothetical protein [Kiloniella majae]|uniref:hypothetical protein n=1 Tax=Kiloniella majae TaxID=1938558 RepID=UPI000A2772DF|nr:hypothetical protein [Kiloniella majae]
MATNLKGSRALLQALDAVSAMEQAGQLVAGNSIKNSDKEIGCRNVKDLGTIEHFDLLYDMVKKN